MYEVGDRLRLIGGYEDMYKITKVRLVDGEYRYNLLVLNSKSRKTINGVTESSIDAMLSKTLYRAGMALRDKKDGTLYIIDHMRNGKYNGSNIFALHNAKDAEKIDRLFSTCYMDDNFCVSQIQKTGW